MAIRATSHDRTTMHHDAIHGSTRPMDEWFERDDQRDPPFEKLEYGEPRRIDPENPLVEGEDFNIVARLQVGLDELVILDIRQSPTDEHGNQFPLGGDQRAYQPGVDFVIVGRNFNPADWRSTKGNKGIHYNGGPIDIGRNHNPDNDQFGFHRTVMDRHVRIHYEDDGTLVLESLNPHGQTSIQARSGEPAPSGRGGRAYRFDRPAYEETPPPSDVLREYETWRRQSRREHDPEMERRDVAIGHTAAKRAQEAVLAYQARLELEAQANHKRRVQAQTEANEARQKQRLQNETEANRQRQASESAAKAAREAQARASEQTPPRDRAEAARRGGEAYQRSLAAQREARKAEEERFFSSLDGQTAALAKEIRHRQQDAPIKVIASLARAIASERAKGKPDKAIYRALAKQAHTDLQGNPHSHAPIALLNGIYDRKEGKLLASTHSAKAT